MCPAGKFSHLAPDTLKQLEEEVTAAAADADKAPHLQQFLLAAQREGGEGLEGRRRCSRQVLCVRQAGVLRQAGALRQAGRL